MPGKSQERERNEVMRRKRGESRYEGENFRWKGPRLYDYHMEKTKIKCGKCKDPGSLRTVGGCAAR